MQEQMEKLWYDRIPMCIEVKGQDTSSSYDSSVLFEQWLIQALPRRYCIIIWCVCLLCEIIIRKSAGLGGRLSVTHGQQPSIHAVLTQRHRSHWGHLLVTMYFKTTSLQLC